MFAKIIIMIIFSLLVIILASSCTVYNTQCVIKIRNKNIWFDHFTRDALTCRCSGRLPLNCIQRLLPTLEITTLGRSFGCNRATLYYYYVRFTRVFVRARHRIDISGFARYKNYPSRAVQRRGEIFFLKPR